MKKLIPALFVAATLFSCNSQNTIKTTDATVKAPIDSLIINWENSWNNHDSAGVRNMFLADALLIDDNLVAENGGEISEKWIHPNILVVNNLKSTKLQEWSGNGRAGYTGKYEFDVIVKDSLITKPTGYYTVNWMKTTEGEWKITTANIHAYQKGN